MADTRGEVDDALTRLRAVHGRLSEYDVLERCVASLTAQLRRQRTALLAAHAALSVGLDGRDDSTDHLSGQGAEGVQVDD